MFLVNGQGKASPAESCAICHGFCWIWRSQELHDTFLGAVGWHLCLLANYRLWTEGTWAKTREGKHSEAWAGSMHPASVVGYCNMAGTGREGDALATGISHCGCPFSPACQDLHRRGIQQELVLDDIRQCSVSISLRFYSFTILWFWRTLLLSYSSLEVRMDTRSVWGENIMPRQKQKVVSLHVKGFLFR